MSSSPVPPTRSTTSLSPYLISLSNADLFRPSFISGRGRSPPVKSFKCSSVTIPSHLVFQNSVHRTPPDACSGGAAYHPNLPASTGSDVAVADSLQLTTTTIRYKGHRVSRRTPSDATTSRPTADEHLTYENGIVNPNVSTSRLWGT